MNLSLSKIPQNEYGEVEFIPWSFFLEKAARGSFKAPVFLSNAERALITLNQQYLRRKQSYQNLERCVRETFSRFGSNEWNGKIQECCDELFETCLLELIPTDAPLDIFQQICKYFDLNSPVLIIEQSAKCVDDSIYNHVWRRQATVDDDEILHDSLTYCLQNWSPSEYANLRRAIKQDMFNYNSQYVTSAMLMLSATWILWGRKPALN